MKKLLVSAALIISSSVFANYYNAYSCKISGQVEGMGLDFILLQNSQYSGLNNHDETQTTKMITESQGEFEITAIEGNTSVLDKNVVLKALKEDGERQYDIIMNLSAVNSLFKSESVQFAKKLKGTVEFRKIQTSNYVMTTTGMKSRVICKRVL